MGTRRQANPHAALVPKACGAPAALHPRMAVPLCSRTPAYAPGACLVREMRGCCECKAYKRCEPVGVVTHQAAFWSAKRICTSLPSSRTPAAHIRPRVACSRIATSQLTRHTYGSFYAAPERTRLAYPTQIKTTMSSYYSSSPASPVGGFFPTGPASPHAFAGFHQSPRDGHAMYAALGASYTPGQGAAASGEGKGPVGSLKRLVKRK